jgi:hypothetical protein
MIVMVVVGTGPNAAGADEQDAEDFHQAVGQPGPGQYRLMLLIVINYKKPEQKQPGQKTADNPAGQMETPERPRSSTRQKKRRRKNAPPTPRRGIHRERLRCQYEFFACPHARSNFRYYAKSSFLSTMILPASTPKLPLARAKVFH